MINFQLLNSDGFRYFVLFIVGGGLTLWLESHATAIGAVLGIITSIYFIISIINTVRKWFKK